VFLDYFTTRAKPGRLLHILFNLYFERWGLGREKRHMARASGFAAQASYLYVYKADVLHQVM
jgi:hypothetical protein